jgi:hypothetical protein
MRLAWARTKLVSDLPICCLYQEELSRRTELIELVVDIDSSDRVDRSCPFCGESWGTLVRYLIVKDLSGNFGGRKVFADSIDIDEGEYVDETCLGKNQKA